MKKDLNSATLQSADDAPETEVAFNQTNFFDQELFEQSPPTLPIEPDPFQAEKDASKKKNKKLFILLGTAAAGLMCIGGAIVLVLSPVTENLQTVIPTPIVISNQTQKTELSKRIDELEKDLKAADPIVTENPFPPVSFDLYLDQTR